MMSEIAASAVLVHPDSLGDTLHAINTALFYQLPLAPAERWAAARWVAGRQGLPHSYAGMFAPTPLDTAIGTLTFTGEAVVSEAGTAHLLSEEACRVLYRLGVMDLPEVSIALQTARRALWRRLQTSQPEGIWAGVYCCGMCSVALWRHLGASGHAEDQRRLDHGLFELKRHRDEKGRWKRFPYHYTLLALSELDSTAVHDEVKYALPGIERALRRVERSDPEAETELERRRRIVMGRLLERF
jgi:hypothetical protein